MNKKIGSLLFATALVPALCGLTAACGGPESTGARPETEVLKANALSSAREVIVYLLQKEEISSALANHLNNNLDKIEAADEIDADRLMAVIDMCGSYAENNVVAVEYLMDAKGDAFLAIAVQAAQKLGEFIQMDSTQQHVADGGTTYCDFKCSTAPTGCANAGQLAGIFNFNGETSYINENAGSLNCVGGNGSQAKAAVSNLKLDVASDIYSMLKEPIENAESLDYDGEGTYTVVSKSESDSNKYSFSIDDNQVLSKMSQESERKNNEGEIISTSSVQTEYYPLSRDEYLENWNYVAQFAEQSKVQENQ